MFFKQHELSLSASHLIEVLSFSGSGLYVDSIQFEYIPQQTADWKAETFIYSVYSSIPLSGLELIEFK